jgi:hypothetical protein
VLAQAPARLDELVTGGVAVVGPIRQQDLTRANGAEQVGGTAAVIGLTFAQLECDRQAVGVDESVDRSTRLASAPYIGRERRSQRRLLRCPLFTFEAC